MWPYYGEFRAFLLFRCLSKTFKSIYHCGSSKLQHPGGRQIWSCFRVFLLFSSIFELRKGGFCRLPARDFFVAATAPPLARRIIRGLPQPPQIRSIYLVIDLIIYVFVFMYRFVIVCVLYLSILLLSFVVSSKLNPQIKKQFVSHRRLGG